MHFFWFYTQLAFQIEKLVNNSPTLTGFHPGKSKSPSHAQNEDDMKRAIHDSENILGEINTQLMQVMFF